MSRLKSDQEDVSQSIRDMFHSQIETLISGQKESKFFYHNKSINHAICILLFLTLLFPGVMRKCYRK